MLQNARRRREAVVTTNYVLAELTALLMSPFRVSHPQRVEYLDTIRNAPWVEVVHVGRDLDRLSWAFLARHRDKDFSLVDCSSFVVMRDSNISSALTMDHHFEQAGFNRLLRTE